MFTVTKLYNVPKIVVKFYKIIFLIQKNIPSDGTLRLEKKTIYLQKKFVI